MKTILYKSYLLLTLFFILSSCRTYAQYNLDINNLTPFTGDWEWVNGNETFTVQLYIEDGHLKGNYELLETNNGEETVIYKSAVPFGNTGHFAVGISGGSHDGIKMGARIADYSWLWGGVDNIKYGSLGFTIQPPEEGCIFNCPITATWKVSKLRSAIRLDTDPIDFVIPTDITLTKVME